MTPADPRPPLEMLLSECARILSTLDSIQQQLVTIQAQQRATLKKLYQRRQEAAWRQYISQPTDHHWIQ